MNKPTLTDVADLIRRRWWLGLLGIAMAVASGQIITVILTSPTPQSPSWNNITVGKTTLDQLRQQFPQIKQDKPQEYLLPSEAALTRPHLITVSGNTVSLIKRQLITSEKLSDYTKTLGPPEAVVYGPHSSAGFHHYLFLQKGVVVVANQYLDEAIEVWYFTPTNLSDFLATWGQGLKTQLSPQF